MSGIPSGVAVPQALFTHCYSHSLNLAASDGIKNYKQRVTCHLRAVMSLSSFYVQLDRLCGQNLSALYTLIWLHGSRPVMLPGDTEVKA